MSNLVRQTARRGWRSLRELERQLDAQFEVAGLLRFSARKTLHTAYLRSLRKAWKRFSAQLAHPEKTSHSRLHAILQSNRDSRFGREHGFDRIRSLQDFQSRVPVRGYDELAPWIRRATEGRSGELTTADVLAFERTSGSSSFAKLIPYTRPLLDELESATSAWLADLHWRHPEIVGLKSYWSISPAIRRGAWATPGGIPIGMPSDLDYFNPFAKWALTQFMVVPKLQRLHLQDANSSSPEIDARLHEWRVKTAAALLSEPELGLISVWSPTFLFPIFEIMRTHWEEVVSAIEPQSRRLQVEDLHDRHADRPILFANKVWPRLKVISCWTDGPSSEPSLRLEGLLPDRTEIEGKGLLATEGVVTIPFSGAPDPVVACGSHFLEFIDLERPDSRPRLAHELKAGGSYSPLMTTSSGLYRYPLRDVLFCTGRNQATPTLRFRGRLDKTSDLCGEKLDAAQVERAFEIACARSRMRPEFFMLTPVLDGPFAYRAFVQSEATTPEILRFVDAFEEALKQNPHYAYALDLGQLKPITVTLIDRGVETWQAHLVKSGVRLGDLKLSRLDSKFDWNEVFSKVTKRVLR